MIDDVVIGGGIVGLSTALHLLRARPGSDVVVLEKEDHLATHQTGHNSGVIHAGVYYEPGSLKARLCRAGEHATKDFCTDHGIPFRTPGKLVVATDDDEAARLAALRDRAERNGITLRPVSAHELRELEPGIAGREAFLVPATGIVDYRRVAAAIAGDVAALGGRVITGTTVTGIREEVDSVRVDSTGGEYRSRRLVACAGLQADRIARLGGLEPDFRIVPFRGEYHALPTARAGFVRHLVYPVPDPALPFLGVHLSPTVDGGITVGPNAVLGLSREGYRRGSVDVRDVVDTGTFPGFWRVARAHWRSGATEMAHSLLRTGYLRDVRRYAPDLTLHDLLPHPAGIRAQAVMRDGTLVHDFLLESTARQLHVCNAPSPAATSALPIGDLIATEVGRHAS